MKYETYFAKTGTIYGVSSKQNFGSWYHNVYKFNSLEVAKKWLKTEEHDFRERELMSKSEAIKLAGKEAVENCGLGIFNERYGFVVLSKDDE